MVLAKGDTFGSICFLAITFTLKDISPPFIFHFFYKLFDLFTELYLEALSDQDQNRHLRLIFPDWFHIIKEITKERRCDYVEMRKM